MDWFIYILFDIRTPDIVRYVGWTIDPDKRLRQHVTRVEAGKDPTRCGRWKQSVLAAGSRFAMAIVDKGAGAGWEETEKAWIAYYRRRFGNKLTNLADGGGGPTGCHWSLSEEQRARRRGRKRGPLSEETKAKLSAVKKGRPASAAAKLAAQGRSGVKRTAASIAKSAAFHRGRKHTDRTKEKLRAVHEQLLPASPRKPHQRSAEYRTKISESLKLHYAKFGSRVATPETRLKISEALKLYRRRKRSA